MKDYAGAVLLNENRDIYLIKEDDKNNIGKDKWNLPGGSIEDEEGLVEAIVRETKEETGFDSEASSLLGCYKCLNRGVHWLYIVFELHVMGNQSETVDPDVKEGRWFTKDDFLSLKDELLVHPDMKLVYKIAIEKRGLSLEGVKFIDYS